MKALVVGLLLGFAASAMSGQGTDGPWLTFSLDRPGSVPARYTIRVEQSTGKGFYHSDLAETGARAADGAETQIAVSQPMLKKMFAAVPLVRSNRCDSHDKNIAQTGVKTLRFAAGSSVFECTYNYALDDRVNTATSVFEAVAETMEYGESLSAKLRFDRLGLDAVMDNLQTALNDGRAVGVGNIAPVLLAIQNDERVMERVRRKASRLLEISGAAAGQSPVPKDSSER